MANRKIQNVIILVKPATVPGEDAAPTGAANAMLVAEMSITPLDAQNIERKNMRGSFGANAELVGVASVKISLTFEVAGSGTPGTPPSWGAPLIGCAMAEGILATPARTEYTPISIGLKDVTIYYYDDGVLHKALGAMGTPTLTANVGERTLFKIDFVGVVGAMTATPNVVADLTSWKIPVALTKANVIDITLGATYAAGAVSGGDPYPSNGLEIVFGNDVQFLADLSTEEVDIGGRAITGSVTLKLTAAEEVAFMEKVKANELQSLAFQIGRVAGNKLLIHAEGVQFTNPKKVDIKGVRYCGYDLRFLQVGTAPEVRLVCL